MAAKMAATASIWLVISEGQWTLYLEDWGEGIWTHRQHSLSNTAYRCGIS
jgi:hypothetical protein